VKETPKQARIIHFALIAGSLLYAGIILSVNVDLADLEFLDSIQLYVYVILSLIFFPLERHLYKRAKESIDDEMSVEEKQKKYISAKITSWALFDGLALFAIAMLFTEPNLYFVFFSLIAILTLIIRYPNVSEMERDFKL
jgi:membrane protein implicated in regulation of membrane protease activity